MLTTEASVRGNFYELNGLGKKSAEDDLEWSADANQYLAINHLLSIG